MPIISRPRRPFDFLDPIGEERDDGLTLGIFDNLGSGPSRPRTATASPTAPSAGLGLGGGDLSSLLPLLGLDGNNEQLDQLGPLFRTLLALQGGGRNGQTDFASLFSGIQL